MKKAICDVEKKDKSSKKMFVNVKFQNIEIK